MPLGVFLRDDFISGKHAGQHNPDIGVSEMLPRTNSFEVASTGRLYCVNAQDLPAAKAKGGTGGVKFAILGQEAFRPKHLWVTVQIGVHR